MKRNIRIPKKKTKKTIIASILFIVLRDNCGNPGQTENESRRGGRSVISRRDGKEVREKSEDKVGRESPRGYI